MAKTHRRKHRNKHIKTRRAGVTTRSGKSAMTVSPKSPRHKNNKKMEELIQLLKKTNLSIKSPDHAPASRTILKKKKNTKKSRREVRSSQTHRNLIKDKDIEDLLFNLRL